MFWTFALLIVLVVALVHDFACNGIGDPVRRRLRVRRPEVSKIDRINELVGASRTHRKHLEASAHELVDLHGYRWGSCEADELAAVIFDGADYAEAMVRIMNFKRLPRVDPNMRIGEQLDFRPENEP